MFGKSNNDGVVENQNSRTRVNIEYKRKDVCKLLVVVFCCLLISAPFRSFVALEPLLVAEGVFAVDSPTVRKEKLNDILSIGFGCTLFSLLLGRLFDKYGSRLLSSLGCLLEATGLVLIALSIKYQNLNNMLYLAYPLYCLGGFMMTYSILGFLWTFPNHQSQLAGLALSVNGISNGNTLVSCLY